jgi:plasmid stability protein
MATLTIRNLPDPTQRALKRRATRNGRSMEAEARAIIGAAMQEPAQKPKPKSKTLSPEAEAALARLKKLFAPKPGEPRGKLVDDFLAERRAAAARE